MAVKLLSVCAVFLLFLGSCSGDSEPNGISVPDSSDSIHEPTNEPTDKIGFEQFLPSGFVLFDSAFGDLNKDGEDDCVLIIKGTDPAFVVNDAYHNNEDMNRRGIIVLLYEADAFKIVSENLNCFSSENEDGGAYYAPDLSAEIAKGNLYLQYSHGRYGYWKYTFRYQNGDMELIGFDDSNSNGPVINSETSINFLTKKKLAKVNTNDEAESGEEIFEEKWSSFTFDKLLKLSGIKDFDELDFSEL